MIVAVLNSVAAVYYYLRPVVVMYMTQPEGEPLEVSSALPATIALAALVVATFWFGTMRRAAHAWRPRSRRFRSSPKAATARP